MTALSDNEEDRLRKIKYEDHLLVQLIELVAERANGEALNELLQNRPLFRDGDGDLLLLGDFLFRLRQKFLLKKRNDATRILDDTYDMTLDKFSHLPPHPDSKDKASHKEQLKYKGSDCRYYYRAFLEWVHVEVRDRACCNQVEEEYVVAGLLQRFVIRHFYLSLLEARRSANPMISRYTWNMEAKGTITVWLPRAMKGSDRRRWLEENVENPDPTQAGERERVQAIVDARIARGYLVPLERVEDTMTCCSLDTGTRLDALFAKQDRCSLPEFVAREKALSIDLQRRAIRALGPTKLEKLVLAVFDNIAESDRTEEELAGEFGLSKAALSRFAGSKWAKGHDGTTTPIPDLWRNTAQVLRYDPRFTEVAKQAGVFERARAATSTNQPLRMRSIDDEQ